ncbi:hypothetical protein Achl_4435 (plasmid) [Pseudarthrobacter chlorophenolicus A6]|uniref:Uncharacterized protein n=1 Tax=Pseudarthrobacter chlorophenolicus (strain ATCC 700700 / DSM 12829 / CIP 107037 / JCM 12360 / KCTC 9906 / NCIMB 13794 / A6) TaxID=452863 RepID=B8HIY9_PSECP|nr:hypothetical protein [Pseudarthrobacter chlorophenolicus]ACL42386.1 hypothetical protein Achl_4435 [Pseudarthrobacter chlorophenolicus A6]SDQ17416.1 hypothetical protein SAMN04489738_0492 [Pseudarthrobacter chlorophenolicus]
MDEYTALEARVNHDGTVDVLVNGSPVPAGCGLTMAAVLELLTRYAGENGKLLMTTTHPNGRVTRDLVSETGEVTPFYPDARTEPSAASETAPDPSHDELYQALKNSGRRVGYADIASTEPVQAIAPSTTRVKLGEGAVPKFDVEADIEKALSAKKPPRSTAKTMVIAVVITLLVLGGLAVGGWLLLNGGDIRGPLPTSLGSVPPLPLL